MDSIAGTVKISGLTILNSDLTDRKQGPHLFLMMWKTLQLKGIKAVTGVAAPVIQFTGVKNGFIQSCRTNNGTGTFLQLKGMENLHITMTENDLSYAKIPVSGDNKSSVFLDANRMPPLYGLSDGIYVNCGMQYTDDREIKIHTPAEVKSKRLEIIHAIWGTDKLPGRCDVS